MKTALRNAKLAFGELEPLAGALLTILLSLVRARITGQVPGFLQARTKFGIELNQSAGNAQSGGASLSNIPAAIGKDQDIELFGRLRCEERLTHHGSGSFGGEVSFQGTTVDRDRAFTGA